MTGENSVNQRSHLPFFILYFSFHFNSVAHEGFRRKKRSFYKRDNKKIRFITCQNLIDHYKSMGFVESSSKATNTIVQSAGICSMNSHQFYLWSFEIDSGKILEIKCYHVMHLFEVSQTHTHSRMHSLLSNYDCWSGEMGKPPTRRHRNSISCVKFVKKNGEICGNKYRGIETAHKSKEQKTTTEKSKNKLSVSYNEAL